MAVTAAQRWEAGTATGSGQWLLACGFINKMLSPEVLRLSLVRSPFRSRKHESIESNSRCANIPETVVRFALLPDWVNWNLICKQHNKLMYVCILENSKTNAKFNCRSRHARSAESNLLSWSEIIRPAPFQSSWIRWTKSAEHRLVYVLSGGVHRR